MYIVILRTLGLCHVRRVAPRPRRVSARQVDLQTLQAVLINRMHVLHAYTSDVTLPEFKKVRLADKGNELLAKARKLLIRRPDWLDEAARTQLARVLENNQTLKTVYELREKLIQIWEEANVSNERLVAELKEWCAEAESSGIRSLEEFSSRLRGYALQPVSV
jgi:stearoyl-CoA desaturase (delta-9 desaturase)